MLINYLPNTKASYYVEHLRLNLSQQLQLNTYPKVNIICRQTTKYILRSISWTTVTISYMCMIMKFEAFIHIIISFLFYHIINTLLISNTKYVTCTRLFDAHKTKLITTFYLFLEKLTTSLLDKIICVDTGYIYINKNVTQMRGRKLF